MPEKNESKWLYLIPGYGIYRIYASNIQDKVFFYTVNIIVSFFLIMISGGGESTPESTVSENRESSVKHEAAVVKKSPVLSKALYNKIRKGMTVKQVRAILGKAGTTSESDMAGLGKSQMWHYQTPLLSGKLETCDIYFTNGRVSMKNWLSI